MNDEEPGWGKTIGAFFLYGCLAIIACIITSSLIVSGMGYSGYSKGGIVATIAAVACAAYYRSTGNFAGPLIASILVGAALGAVAVWVSLALAGM